jgi:hypothetical protein
LRGRRTVLGLKNNEFLVPAAPIVLSIVSPISSAVVIQDTSLVSLLKGVEYSVAYHGDTSHFFGIGISRYQIQPVSVFFGRYYRVFGKISSFMVWLSKKI